MENEIKPLAIVIVFACISGCTGGSAVVSGQERSRIDSAAVTLYSEPPPHYEVVGIVEAFSNIEFSDEAAEERAFVELKKQAAKIGANGVIEWEVDETLGSVNVHNPSTGTFSTWPQRRFNVKGTAIYVTSNNRSE
jgi:uncharacterized protein YbjQ (UPF0145 family)